MKRENKVMDVAAEHVNSLEPSTDMKQGMMFKMGETYVISDDAVVLNSGA